MIATQKQQNKSIIQKPFGMRKLESNLRKALAAATILVAAACGQQNDASNKTKVALLTPGSITDQGWNTGAYNGLLAIRDSLDAHISHIQTRTPAEFEENFRHYGAQKFDLVIGHGFEFQDAAMRVAPDYPNTIFVCTSGSVTAPNVAGMNFAFEEGSYQAGMLAAAISKTGILGMIGGTELPTVKSSFAAFTQGALSVNPNIQVLEAYLGSWDDVTAGKEQTLAQINRGADVIFQNADAAGLGIFTAVKEKDVLAFGANSNQNHLAPNHIVASVVIDLTKALLTVARDVEQGTFVGGIYQMGNRSGVVNLVVNENLRTRIPAQIQASIDSVGVEILEGRFSISPNDND